MITYKKEDFKFMFVKHLDIWEKIANSQFKYFKADPKKMKFFLDNGYVSEQKRLVNGKKVTLFKGNSKLRIVTQMMKMFEVASMERLRIK